MERTLDSVRFDYGPAEHLKINLGSLNAYTSQLRQQMAALESEVAVLSRLVEIEYLCGCEYTGNDERLKLATEQQQLRKLLSRVPDQKRQRREGQVAERLRDLETDGFLGNGEWVNGRDVFVSEGNAEL